MRVNKPQKTLVVLTGPTAVGKTETSIRIAQKLEAEIISADARQFYKELKIGTAAPTPTELSQVTHHLTGHLSVFDYYNASLFEKHALQILEKLFQKSDYAILTGGSGLYIDTLCYGIGPLPDIDPNIRSQVKAMYHQQGIEALQEHLKQVDPAYYDEVDISNPNRMMRGLETYLSTGKKFSELRQNTRVSRPFQIKKIILNRPRKELFDRIELRTEQMIKEGLTEEALKFFKYRHLNALNTVGYKEIYAWLGNRWDMATAKEKIKTHTRRYAKRQITWFKRYENAKWFLPSEIKTILAHIQNF